MLPALTVNQNNVIQTSPSRTSENTAHAAKHGRAGACFLIAADHINQYTSPFVIQMHADKRCMISQFVYISALKGIETEEQSSIPAKSVKTICLNLRMKCTQKSMSHNRSQMIKEGQSSLH